MITNLQEWILKLIVKKLVRQGEWHEYNIITYYSIMSNALYNEFTEDNLVTLKNFSENCFDLAWKL
jgi:hypothetical protein